MKWMIVDYLDCWEDGRWVCPTPATHSVLTVWCQSNVYRCKKLPSSTYISLDPFGIVLVFIRCLLDPLGPAFHLGCGGRFAGSGTVTLTDVGSEFTFPGIISAKAGIYRVCWCRDCDGADSAEVIEDRSRAPYLSCIVPQSDSDLEFLKVELMPEVDLQH